MVELEADRTVKQLYEMIVEKLKFSWKTDPTHDVFMPHLNPKFTIKIQKSDPPACPVNRLVWQKSSLNKLRAGIPKSDGECMEIDVTYDSKSLVECGLEEKSTYCMRLIDRNPNSISDIQVERFPDDLTRV